MVELLTLLYDKYIGGCIEFVLDGFVDGKVSERRGLFHPHPHHSSGHGQTVLRSLLRPTPSGGGQRHRPHPALCHDRRKRAAEKEDETHHPSLPSTSTRVTPAETLTLSRAFTSSASFGVSAEPSPPSPAAASTPTSSPCPNAPVFRSLVSPTYPEESLYDFQFNLEAWSPPGGPSGSPRPISLPSPLSSVKCWSPRLDTTRYTALLKLFVGNGTPILLVGETGTAKTVTINAYLSHLDPTTHTYLNLNFSSQNLFLRRPGQHRVERG